MLLLKYICEGCKEQFESHPAQNAWCSVCGCGHVLCPACWFAHKMDAEWRKMNQA